MKRPLLLFYIVALSVFSSSAPAEIYRWVDENGQVHYEDRSKAQRDKGTHSYKPPEESAHSPKDRMDKTRRLLNAYQIERQKQREEREKKKKDEEQRRRNCIVAKDNLLQYQSYGVIYRLDEDGNRIYLDDQQREALLQKSRDAVAKWCK